LFSYYLFDGLIDDANIDKYLLKNNKYLLKKIKNLKLIDN